MPDARKQRLVDLLAAKDVALIEDDIYGDLYFGESRPRTCKSMDTTGNVILCSSVSKMLAPGYRVGWCIPGRHLQRVMDLKRIHSLSSTHVTHAAVGQFFAHNRISDYRIVASQGATEGAQFIRDHMIRVTDRAFDDFAGAKTDANFNRRVLGLK